MSNEAASQLLFEPADYTGYTEQMEQMSSYEMANSVDTIASMMQFITTTRTMQVALVTIGLHFEQEIKDGKILVGRQVIDRSMRYFLEDLRRRVRKTDIVYVLGSTCYFILLGATLDGGSIVQERLWDALLWRVHNINESEILRPRRMSVGHSAYPFPCQNAHECIMASHEVLQSIDTYPERAGRKTSTRNHRGAVSEVIASAAQSPDTAQENELQVLARKLGIPYLSLLPRKRPEQVRQLIAVELIKELQCYPLGRERGTLTVALSDPQDQSVLDRLQKETGLHIFPVLTHPQELQTALQQLV